VSDQIRTIDASEIEDWVACMGVGFLFEVPEGYGQYLLGDCQLDRTWAAFDDDRIVGTLRSFPTAFTVPGPTQVSAAALTNVTVSPTHRRRGLLSQMLEADLVSSHERGEAIGILVSAEYPIYGRFGYGPAIYGANYVIDSPRVRFLEPSAGNVELVDRETLRAEAPPVYEEFRATQTGSIERLGRWWDRVLHQVEVPGAKLPRGYQALYRTSSGDVEGYLRYNANEETEGMLPKGTLNVEELVAVTPRAYQRLWQFCCEVDLLTSVRADDRSVEEMLPWFIEDARSVRQTARFDFVWVRILDVPRALAGRLYSANGRVVVEVTDPLGISDGRYALEASPYGASCERVHETPEVAMPVAALGAIYPGGVSLGALARAGWVDEHRPGTVETIDLMFRSADVPWCSTQF